MKIDVARYFSASDLEAIERAVKAAERRTSGEIVPYAVAHCDDYEVAPWKAACLGALVSALGAAFVYQVGGFWGEAVPVWIAAPATVGAALAFLLATLVPTLRRWLVPRDELADRVAARAAAAFLEQEVFATRERTGILIFIAMFERRVVVLGDAGINARVEPREWEAIVGEIVAGIRAGRAGAALVAAIERCGVLLERHAVERRSDDTDELDDRLRFRQE